MFSCHNQAAGVNKRSNRSQIQAGIKKENLENKTIVSQVNKLWSKLRYG